MKKKLFILALCVTMLIPSLNVFAGYTSGNFGGGASGEASLSTSSLYITARTVAYSSGSVSTQVRALGRYGNHGIWAYGGSSATTTAVAADTCCGAESYHYIDTASVYLTCGL